MERNVSGYIRPARADNRESRLATLSNYPDVLTVPHVMELLHLGKSNVYRLIKDKTLPAFRMKGGRKYLIPKDGVAMFISNMCYTEDSVSGSSLEGVHR